MTQKSVPVPASPENIRKAAESIRKGGLASFPTETVYGLGADALNPTAVAGVFELKQRPFFDPLIVHIADRDTLEALTTRPGAYARRLMDAFWPGALTLVLPKKETVPDITTGGLSTVAVRMPSHTVALDLIRASRTPIAAPSANRFGRLSPTTAQHVADQFESGIDVILDGGPCAIGIESTVISLAGDRPLILRAGGISVEDIQAALGEEVERAAFNPAKPQSPGQLPQHYSPRTPLHILDSQESDGPSRDALHRCGLLAFRQAPPPDQGAIYGAVEILSPRGDLREAASRLFACMHTLDRAGLDRIYAERLPEQGLGLAIMDRLRRARGLK